MPPEVTEAPYRPVWRERLQEIREQVYRPAPSISASEWAAARRVLTKGAMAGQVWTNEEAPYLAEIMDAISDAHRPRKAVVLKSARVGYTEGIIGNCVGFFIDQEPTDVIVMQPTDEEADAYSKENLDPLFRETPCLRARLHLDAYKDSRNTIAYKAFPGGSLSIIGPKPSALRRRSGRIAFSDEIDELEDIYEQGDPLLRLDKRLDDFDDSIHVRGSTPTNKGMSRIEKEYAGSDQRRYYVDCPGCGVSQPLEWGGKETTYGIKWAKEVICRGCGAESDYGDRCSECGAEALEVRHLPETAHYVCVEGCRIEEHEKRAMVQRGSWIATNPEGRYPGWHVHALMSLFPGARWSKLVEEWIAAQGDPEALKVFVNTVLGEVWEERDQKRVSAEGLAARAEVYATEVPMGVGVLVAGVDVQGDRLELLVRGYGAGHESWDVLHERIIGDPEKTTTWGRLDNLLARAYEHESGATLRIAACMIDSGYKTDAVYDFVRPRSGRNIWASKGDAGSEGAPPLKRPSRANSAKVKVWTVGTFTMKDRLFGRLAVEEPGPRYSHFRQMDPDLCNGFDAEYFAQAGAEKKIRKRIKGTLRWRHEWVQVRNRNEFIDLQVLCDAALRALGAGVYEHLGEIAEALRARASGGPDEPEPDSGDDWVTGGGRWGRW